MDILFCLVEVPCSLWVVVEFEKAEAQAFRV